MSHVDPFGPELVDLRKISRSGQGLLFLPDISRNGKQHSLPKYSYTIEDLGWLKPPNPPVPFVLGLDC